MFAGGGLAGRTEFDPDSHAFETLPADATIAVTVARAPATTPSTASVRASLPRRSRPGRHRPGPGRDANDVLDDADGGDRIVGDRGVDAITPAQATTP